MINRFHRIKLFEILLLLCISLCACSNSKQLVSDNLDVEKEMKEYENNYTFHDLVDVIDIKWNREEEITQEKGWQVQKYTSPLFQLQSGNEELLGCHTYNSDIYGLYYCMDSKQEKIESYTLRKIDLNTMEQEQWSVEPDQENFITDFDVSDGKICIFLEKYNQQDGILGLYGCFMTNGNLGEKIDLLPAATSYGLIDENNIFQGICRYDGHENIFIIMGDDINVGGTTDINGKSLYSFNEYFPDTEAIYSSVIKCENGRSLVVSYSQMKENTTIFGVEKEQMIPLCNFEGSFFNHNAICDKYGNITFVQQGVNVLNWNVCDGKIDTYISGGFGDEQDILALIRKNQGNIVEVTDNVEGLSIVEYSPVQGIVDTTITIEALSGVDEDFMAGIRLYEKTHPQVKICLKPLGDQDVNQKKALVFSNITSEDGADIIYMERSDMVYFAEKDCLLNLSEKLSDETKMSYLPGIASSGEWNGEWYMIPTAVNVSAVYVNKECYQEGKWNIEGLLDIIKTREREGQPFEDIWLLYESHAAPGEILQFFMSDIMNSEFMDYKNGHCDFESKRFGEILELCKKYGKDDRNRMPINREERSEKLLQQKTLCFSEPLLSFGNYSKLGASLNGKVDIAGMPTDSFSGHQFTAIEGVAVNKYSQKNEAISDFLDCMFNQQYYNINPVNNIPLRKDCLKNKILLQADWTNQAVVNISKHISMRVERKPDGGSYEEDYLEFLNQCVPYDDKNDTVISIIVEEAEPYFQGEKEKEAVQTIIQSRIQLYLDENVQ